jgi:two-component system nitrate/nitrite response regulator NarL
LFPEPSLRAQVAVIIIEPRTLVREAIEALMGDHSYRVVCSVGASSEISGDSVVDAHPKLVILGAKSAEISAREAQNVRALWPDSKILLLCEDTPLSDFPNLMESQIDACIPVSTSPEMLFNSLDLLMGKDIRLVVMEALPRSSAAVEPGNEIRHMPEAASTAQPPPPLPKQAGRFSARESQILKGLVKGHANKIIARECDITEATVKVHIKSILRKIQVANRTQAAIWAMENLYQDENYPASQPDIVKPHWGTMPGWYQA